MMDLRQRMENDSRFVINQETMDSLFRNHTIYDYSLDRIAVGRIRRTIGKKIYRLDETINYKMLQDPTSESLRREYDSYSRQANNTKDNSNRSLETFDNLVSLFSNEDYSLTKGAIVINQYNFIMDGLHRSCILLKNYGPEYEIDVVRIKCKIAKRIYLSAPLFELKQRVKGM